MDYQDDLVVSLPMLEFDVSLNVEEEECNSVHSEDMEDFDVFAAANNQRRRRSSILDYGSNNAKDRIVDDSNNCDLLLEDSVANESEEVDDVLNRLGVWEAEEGERLGESISYTVVTYEEGEEAEEEEEGDEENNQECTLVDMSTATNEPFVNHAQEGESITEQVPDQSHPSKKQSLQKYLTTKKFNATISNSKTKNNTDNVSNPKLTSTFSSRRALSSSSTTFTALTTAAKSRQRTKAVDAVTRHKESIKACHTKLKLTIPQSPKIWKTVKYKKPLSLTREEEELARLEEEKKRKEAQMKHHKRIFEMASRKMKVSGCNVQMTVRSSKQLTIPKTPISKLNAKYGEKHCSIVSNIETENENESDNHQKKEVMRGPTHPEPFKFETDKRATLHKTTDIAKMSPQKTALEIQQDFFKDTRSTYVPENACKTTTIPRTPKLRVIARSKSCFRQLPKSHEEMEKEEMEEIQKNSFKAAPVDRRIFESAGEFGVPKVTSKPITETQAFELRIDQRSISRRGSTTDSKDENFVFKANPMPAFKEIPVDMLALQEARASYKPIVPQSPHLSGKDSASTAPARRQKPHHKIVEEEKALALKTSISRKPGQLTEPISMNLHTAERGFSHKAQLAAKLQQEKQKENQERQFHAKPLDAKIFDKPAQPKPSDKELTEPHEFKLRTALRVRASNVQEQPKKPFDFVF